jgi:hypothetical protein
MLLRKNLTPIKALAKTSIDDAAERTRLLFVTPGAAQTMVYKRKFEQALALMENPEIDDAAIPAIVNEVGVTAPTRYEVAQVILNMEAMWGPLADRIERARLQAKNEVDAATCPAEIDAAAQIDWQQVVSQAA